MDWVQTSEANRVFFDEMVAVWSMADAYQESDFEANETQGWAKIEDKLSKKSAQNPMETPVVSFFSWRKIVAVAASVALIALALSWGLSDGWLAAKQTIISADQQQELPYTLPDGSTVWLNDNSEIRFVKNFKKREIHLVGEAFFEVKHLAGNPFEIIAGDAKTRVLGTTFNVRAYPQEAIVEVTVATGKVEFFNNNKEETTVEKVVLTAGNSGILTKMATRPTKLTKGFSNALAWKTSSYQFDNFKDVLQSIERYFKVKVTVENPKILNCNFTNTGRLQDLTLEILQELIAFQTNQTIQLTKDENGYTLQGKGCE